MRRWTWMALVLGLAVSAGANEPEPGRTDGPEGSEYGTGGYWRYRSEGRLFVGCFLGAAAVEMDDDDPLTDDTQTDLVAGGGVGYLVEDWLAFELGYGHIFDQKTELYAMGMRSEYRSDPFNVFVSLGAEIYSPEAGDEKFGIVPGVGAEMVLSDHLRVGLGFQHDFIFADEAIRVSRFTTRVQLTF